MEPIGQKPLPQQSPPTASAAPELESAACDCCGLMEECTPEYAACVRERYGGRWICGLCSAAVQEEVLRSAIPISIEEAIARHISFCRAFRAAAAAPPANDNGELLISAVRQLLRRSLGSPRAVRSAPNSPRKKVGAATDGGAAVLPASALARTESCFPTLAS